MVFMTYNLNGKKIELIQRQDGWVDLVLSFPNTERHPYITPVGIMVDRLTGCPVTANSEEPVIFKPIMYRLDGYIDNLLSRDI
jgi:hypothetical protein